jgi:hypothetical protein
MYPILDAFARVFSYREQLRVLCLLALLALVGPFALHFRDVSASEGYCHSNWFPACLWLASFLAFVEHPQ